MDLAKAKGEALVNLLIIYSNEKYNRVMLNDVGKENGKKKTTTTLHVQHTFLYIYLPLLPVFLFAFFFSQPLIFTLLAATGRYKIFMLLFQRNSALSLFISRSSSLSLFFSLSFASLSPTISFSLSFSFSIFQICGHDN